MSAYYRLIVPVQAPHLAMPRSGLSPDVRAQLSLAFAKDTLDVLRACPSVHDVTVVSPDCTVEDLATAFDASFVRVPAGVALNAAVNLAYRKTKRESDQMVATIVSDLPALNSDELEDVFTSAGRRYRTAYVTDLGHASVTMQLERATTFTACLAAQPTQRRTPRGTPIEALVPGIRGDVDTRAGLQVATFMGVGPATRQAMDELTTELSRSHGTL